MTERHTAPRILNLSIKWK